MTFVETGLVVLPVFVLIGVGWLAGRTGALKDSVGEGLGDFVFLIAIPVLMFRTIATSQLPEASPWPLWAAYFGGVLVAWPLGTAIAVTFFGRSRAEGVIAGAAASFSNTIMVGIPLVYAARGEAGVVPLLLIISVHLPVMMSVGTILVERAARLDREGAEPLRVAAVGRRILVNLAGNPLIVALALGALWRLSGLPLAGPPRQIVDQLAAAGLPCALFSLGMGLKRYGIFGEARLAILLSVVKLVLMPAIVLALGRWLFDLPPVWVAVLTITAGCPAGVNAYLFSVRFGVGHATASNSIGISTLAAVFTMTAWLDVLARLG